MIETFEQVDFSQCGLQPCRADSPSALMTAHRAETTDHRRSGGCRRLQRCDRHHMWLPSL